MISAVALYFCLQAVESRGWSGKSPPGSRLLLLPAILPREFFALRWAKLPLRTWIEAAPVGRPIIFAPEDARFPLRATLFKELKIPRFFRVGGAVFFIVIFPCRRELMRFISVRRNLGASRGQSQRGVFSERRATNMDVVDDAGGDDIATTKVVTDVSPGSDETIRVDFSDPGVIRKCG